VPVSKKVKKAKIPKAPKGRGGSGRGKDPITGNWSTEDGILLTFEVTSNNTRSRRYFAIADMDSYNGSHPVNYRGYADTNSNGFFDADVDMYTATASVASWDGIPRYSGTFRAESGKLTNLGGPANSFIIPQDFFG